MSGKTITLRPEFSALGRRKPISPFLTRLIRAVLEERRRRGLASAQTGLEYGCGQLRNLKELKRHFPQVVLVDTEFQLNRVHDFAGKPLTAGQYVRRHYKDGSVTVMSDVDFRASDLRPDVIFSINVMDVVPPQTRRSILSSIRDHLPLTGQFVSLVPRNDSRTLNLCRHALAYRDGHVFSNHGAHTFYKNWPDTTLQRLYRIYSLEVIRDLSRYRHSCLICMGTSISKRPRWKRRPSLSARKLVLSRAGA